MINGTRLRSTTLVEGERRGQQAASMSTLHAQGERRGPSAASMLTLPALLPGLQPCEHDQRGTPTPALGERRGHQAASMSTPCAEGPLEPQVRHPAYPLADQWRETPRRNDSGTSEIGSDWAELDEQPKDRVRTDGNGDTTVGNYGL